MNWKDNENFGTEKETESIRLLLYWRGEKSWMVVESCEWTTLPNSTTHDGGWRERITEIYIKEQSGIKL